MRIISGIAGGLRLRAPQGQLVRPTTDRVKESIFASLGDLRGLCVLDLYSGSGALGLEAASRGADSVYLVEKDPRHLRVIGQNLQGVRKAFEQQSFQPSIQEVRADVRHLARHLAALAGKVDVILADPPYHCRSDEYGAAALLTDTEFASWAGQALLVLEYEAGSPLPFSPLSTWDLQKERRYGKTVVAFCRQKQP
jgi:16S rRNA (guanine966-N2)-methyltransferase